MKKSDRSVEVADLDAVAHFDEDLVIYIDKEEEVIPTSLCVLANFNTRKFDVVKPMADYLKSQSYLPIQDGDTQISYRQRIVEEMEPDVIAAMLRDFTQKHLHR